MRRACDPYHIITTISVKFCYPEQGEERGISYPERGRRERENQPAVSWLSDMLASHDVIRAVDEHGVANLIDGIDITSLQMR